MSLHNKLYSKQESNTKVLNVKWHIRNSNVIERKIWTDSVAEETRSRRHLILWVTSKLIKKGYPFPSCRYKCQLIKRLPFFIFCKQMYSLVNATPFSTLQRNFLSQKSCHKPIFDILNRLIDIDKKKVTKSKHHRLVTNIEKGYPFFKKKGKAFLHFLKITY